MTKGPRLAGAKVLIAQALCHPAVGRALGWFFSDRIPSRGHAISTDGEGIHPSVKAMLFWGMYESAEIRFVRKYLRSDLDVIELGASIGVVSAQIASLLQPGRTLTSVEANPELIGRIEVNVRRNSSIVPTVLHKAIDHAGRQWAELVLGGSNLGSAVDKATDGRMVRVPTITLAELASTFGQRGYSLVSDIEGAEAGFIMGSPEVLKDCRQIIIELHDTTHRGERLEVPELVDALVSTHGFRVRDQYGPVYAFERAE